MAKRKKSKPRRKKSLSSGGTTKRRRSSAGRRTKGFLSDMTNPTMLMNGAKTTLSAAAGGVAGTAVHKWISPSASKLQKALTILAIGIAGNAFGFPHMTAGAVGAMVSQSFPNGLNDDADFADGDALADKPLYLDDDGAPMVLEEGPQGANMRYLSDEEIDMMERAGAFDDYTEVG